MGSLVHQENVTLGLSLALTVGATGMLTQTQAIVSVAVSYLALALLDRMWSLQAWHDWATFWNVFLFKSMDATLLLFAVGYLLLYVRQTQGVCA